MRVAARAAPADVPPYRLRPALGWAQAPLDAFVARARFTEIAICAPAGQVAARLDAALAAAGWTATEARADLVGRLAADVEAYGRAHGVELLELYLCRSNAADMPWHVDATGAKHDLFTPTANYCVTLSGRPGTAYLDPEDAARAGILAGLHAARYGADPGERARVGAATQAAADALPHHHLPVGQPCLIATGYGRGLCHRPPPNAGLRLFFKARPFTHLSGTSLTPAEYATLTTGAGFLVLTHAAPDPSDHRPGSPAPRVRGRAPRGVALVALLALLAVRAGAAEPPTPGPPDGDQPVIDVVTDAALLAGGLGFSVLSELIVRTGEIRPQAPGSTSKLLAIDRHFAEHDASATQGSIMSNVGAGLVGAYAVAAAIWTGTDRGATAGWVDATLYAESALLNWTLANLAKLAIRRPRPSAYLSKKEGGPTDTDSALSFYSGHTAISAGLVTTAAYLAFVRHPDSDLGWWVIGVGGALVGAVGTGRVLGRSHFPTDVIAGGMAGIGIGLLVPHLHMPESGRTYWVGSFEEGRGLSLGGTF